MSYGRSQLRLRTLLDADAEWAFALHREVLGEYVAELWGWDEATQRRMFFERLAKRSRQVIEVDGEPVGVLEVEDRPDELYLGLIELSPKWQGRGLGADILKSLIDRAWRSGKPLSLHVLTTNPRARTFYERAGIRVVSTESARSLMRTTDHPSDPNKS